METRGDESRAAPGEASGLRPSVLLQGLAGLSAAGAIALAMTADGPSGGGPIFLLVVFAFVFAFLALATGGSRGGERREATGGSSNLRTAGRVGTGLVLVGSGLALAAMFSFWWFLRGFSIGPR